MAILTVKEIIEAKDITEQELPVPEWGGEVRVRSISHREMKNIKKKIADAKGPEGEATEDDIEKWVLIKGMVEPQITEEEYDHLLEKSTSSITKSMYASASSHSGATACAPRNVGTVSIRCGSEAASSMASSVSRSSPYPDLTSAVVVPCAAIHPRCRSSTMPSVP